MKLRWNLMRWNLGLPYVTITHKILLEVAHFAGQELSEMIVKEPRGSDPSKPLKRFQAAKNAQPAQTAVANNAKVGGPTAKPKPNASL